MEAFDFTFSRGRRRSFDEAPDRAKHKIFGVDYIHLKGRQSGDLFVTQHGWPLAPSIAPERWFTGPRFAKSNRPLAGATGAVYRIPAPHADNEDFSVVVKFCRFGQDVGVTATDSDPDLPPEFIERLTGAEFLPPFEEFGNLERLRAALGNQIDTNLPLAIYCPPTRYLDWQLGRKSHLQWMYTRSLKADQETATPQGLEPNPGITYHWERLYILLYAWLDGVDAEQAERAGLMSRERMRALSIDVRSRLQELGWAVLDHKARHCIVRPRHDRFGIEERDGRPHVGLIDYELLVPWGHPPSHGGLARDLPPTPSRWERLGQTEN